MDGEKNDIQEAFAIERSLINGFDVIARAVVKSTARKILAGVVFGLLLGIQILALCETSVVGHFWAIGFWGVLGWLSNMFFGAMGLLALADAVDRAEVLK